MRLLERVCYSADGPNKVEAQNLDAAVEAITSVTFASVDADGAALTATMTFDADGSPSFGNDDFATLNELSSDATLQAANTEFGIRDANFNALDSAVSAADAIDVTIGLTTGDATFTSITALEAASADAGTDATTLSGAASAADTIDATVTLDGVDTAFTSYAALVSAKATADADAGALGSAVPQRMP